jgi:crotonobetainyl-CoA:carnitine CoA-transferase CaiB-like acyl-CoA transferase
MKMRWVYPARDGYVAVSLLFGSAAGPMTRRLMEYIYEEGGCDEATRDKDWIGYTELVFSGKEPQEEYERVKQVVAEFTATKTKAELLRAALERGLLIAPVATIDEVAASEQLAARDYWRDVPQPLAPQALEDEGASLRHPGPFARFSATPIQYRRPAPRIGQHNREVYVDELGLSEAELARLQREGIV